MERYLIDIEYSLRKGDWPISIYLSAVNIDPKGYRIGEYHGKSLNAGVRKCSQMILDEESKK